MLNLPTLPTISTISTINARSEVQIKDMSGSLFGCIHQTSVASYSAQTVQMALSKRTNSKPIAEKLRPAKILLMLAPLPQPQLGKTNPMDKGRGEGQKLLLDLTCCADRLR